MNKNIPIADISNEYTMAISDKKNTKDKLIFLLRRPKEIASEYIENIPFAYPVINMFTLISSKYYQRIQSNKIKQYITIFFKLILIIDNIYNNIKKYTENIKYIELIKILKELRNNLCLFIEGKQNKELYENEELFYNYYINFISEYLHTFRYIGIMNGVSISLNHYDIDSIDKLMITNNDNYYYDLYEKIDNIVKNNDTNISINTNLLNFSKLRIKNKKSKRIKTKTSKRLKY